MGGVEKLNEQTGGVQVTNECDKASFELITVMSDVRWFVIAFG